jgi:hypothetical protein
MSHISATEMPVEIALAGHDLINTPLFNKGSLVTSLIMIPLTLVLVRVGVGGDKATGNTELLVVQSFADTVKQPVVWLAIAGAILALAGIHLPQDLALSFDPIGKSAAGVALFALGMILYGQRLRVDQDIALNALLKSVGQPAVFLGLILLLGIHGASARKLFPTGAILTTTAASMLALRYRAYADESAASTLVSTVGLIATISLAIILAERLG